MSVSEESITLKWISSTSAMSRPSRSGSSPAGRPARGAPRRRLVRPRRWPGTAGTALLPGRTAAPSRCARARDRRASVSWGSDAFEQRPRAASLRDADGDAVPGVEMSPASALREEPRRSVDLPSRAVSAVRSSATSGIVERLARARSETSTAMPTSRRIRAGTQSAGATARPATTRSLTRPARPPQAGLLGGRRRGPADPHLQCPGSRPAPGFARPAISPPAFCSGLRPAHPVDGQQHDRARRRSSRPRARVLQHGGDGRRSCAGPRASRRSPRRTAPRARPPPRLPRPRSRRRPSPSPGGARR